MRILTAEIADLSPQNLKTARAGFRDSEAMLSLLLVGEFRGFMEKRFPLQRGQPLRQDGQAAPGPEPGRIDGLFRKKDTVSDFVREMNANPLVLV